MLGFISLICTISFTRLPNNYLQRYFTFYSLAFNVCRILGTNISRIDTLVYSSLGNDSAYTFIQEHAHQPGLLIAFLTHAIVEFDVSDPSSLRLVAGRPDISGCSDGLGPDIRFNHPWDMVQINHTCWVISDSGNNCLRLFNYGKNQQSQSSDSAISSWSSPCSSTITKSTIGHTIQESSLVRPRGLSYLADEDKIYVTYEEPYSLAEIHLGTMKVIIRYSSDNWPLRRILPFCDEIIISTDPEELLLSYRDFKLGTVISTDWPSNVPAVRNVSQPFFSGLSVLPSHMEFLVTRSNRNLLVYVDRKKGKVIKICKGARGHANINLNECELDSPRFVAVINYTIYIGEHCSSGGGIRTISITPGEALKR